MRDFGRFLKEGKVRRGEKDAMLATSLVQMAEQDLEFLRPLRITEISARRIVSNYYDVMRSLLEAMAALDGYKVYSHEAFTDYLDEVKGEQRLSERFDRLRKIRNGINYYGKSITIEEAEELALEMIALISAIRSKLPIHAK
ncbi:MAG TPA: hypothetical protein VJB12_03050 [Candidatus Nanoarchaeia archaeon]|nr:hypothetical protein [Candidatus Nanoarchaeia archaeon]